jgi:hypothetical protein
MEKQIISTFQLRLSSDMRMTKNGWIRPCACSKIIGRTRIRSVNQPAARKTRSEVPARLGWETGANGNAFVCRPKKLRRRRDYHQAQTHNENKQLVGAKGRPRLKKRPTGAFIPRVLFPGPRLPRAGNETRHHSRAPAKAADVTRARGAAVAHPATISEVGESAIHRRKQTSVACGMGPNRQAGKIPSQKQGIKADPRRPSPGPTNAPFPHQEAKPASKKLRRTCSKGRKYRGANREKCEDASRFANRPRPSLLPYR